ncbi:serine/threonine-protein kinase [Myxococcus eversor]|uniref:serine/threonine-protein kinase n=1 Tax=Myxococcus eversor TaxID=2709661 RepID=UPI001F080844|nr:serine/threonine-protein kinase [Myxococcus eversor]
MTARERTPGDAETRSADSLLATQVGEYVIEERIGSGGMGVVYRATHPLIGKQVAIKVLREELVSHQQVERLLIEARAVNAIRHAGIIDIFGFGRLPDGRPYITMELLRGESLSTRLRQGRLDANTTRWVLDQVLSALGAAHKAGVVHRDLKPGNIFLTDALDGTPLVKLVDFGIAKLVQSHDGPTTVHGSILGTPEYMAPEQIRGASVSPATDLYALGVIAFQMLTGELPFKGEQLQVLFAHVEEPPPLPSSKVPGLPPEFDTLILHLMAKDPALRPGSAEAVRQAVQRIPRSEAPPLPVRPEPVEVAPSQETTSRTTRSTIVPPSVKRQWLRAGPMAVLLVTSVACGAFILGRGGPWMAERPTAPEQARVVPKVASSVAIEPRTPMPEAPAAPTRGTEQDKALTTTVSLAPENPPTTSHELKSSRVLPKSRGTQLASVKESNLSRRSGAPVVPAQVSEAVKSMQHRLTTESLQAEQVLRAKVGEVANGSPALNELHAIRQRIPAALTVQDCDVLKRDLAHWKHARLGPATGTSLRAP